jgi:hypothetical protein
MAHRDSRDVFAIGTFAPSSSVGLCNQFTGPVLPSDSLCADAPGSLAANNPSDVTTRLAIGVADYDYSLLVNASPAMGFMAAGPGNPAHVGGTDPALGDLIGQVVTEFSVGATNVPCDSNVVLPMKLLNGTTDNSSANSLNPVPPAQTAPIGGGVLENMQSDTGTAPTAIGYAPPAGIPANGLPAAVDRYPSFLNAMFDPDFTNYGPNGVPFDGDDVNGATPPLQPLSRYVGSSVVSGMALELNLVVFTAGALAGAFPAPHPFANLTSDMGYTTVAVFQDPTQTAPPSFLDNICTDRASIQTLWGEARANPCNGVTAAPCNTTGGIIDPAVGANNGLDRARTPPSAGSYLYLTYLESQRDSEPFLPGLDGIENSLDTCPTVTNMDASPKISAGADGDMIDSACDPTPAVDTGGGNHDGDTAPNGAAIINVADNCPLIANGTQTESELTHSVYEAVATNPAPQGGPKSDGIGDACDSDDTKANGDYLADLDVTAKCIGGTDADGDGYCTAIDSGVAASDPNDANAAVTPEDYDLVFVMTVAHAGAGDNPPERLPVQVCNDGIDNDGDTLIDNLDWVAGNSTCRPAAQAAHPGFPACPITGCSVDSDGDGSTNEAERHVGTNPLGRCGIGEVPARSADWPLDLVSGGIPQSTDRVNILDLSNFVAPVRRLDTSPGNPNFNVRWDIKPGPDIPSHWVQVTDLATLISGVTGFPPMSSGARVFGGPLCSAHPVFGQ